MRTVGVILVGFVQYLVVVPIAFVLLCIVMAITGVRFWGGVVLGAAFSRIMLPSWAGQMFPREQVVVQPPRGSNDTLMPYQREVHYL